MKDVELLKLAGVPEDLHAEALASLADSKRRFRKLLPYRLAAPFVMMIVAPFLKWKANCLPDFVREFDVEPLIHIDINGDQKPRTEAGELDGIKQYEYESVPLEDTMEARTLCYWARDWCRLFTRPAHPRQNWARFVFLGLRNRAARARYDAGEVFTPAQFWIQRGLPGYDIVVFRMREHWQISAQVRFWKFFALRINHGFAINNIHWGERRTRDLEPVRVAVKRSWGVRMWKEGAAE